MSIKIGNIDDLKAKIKEAFNKVLDKGIKDMYIEKRNTLSSCDYCCAPLHVEYNVIGMMRACKTKCILSR